MTNNRIKSGIAGFDELTGGGIEERSVILIRGGTGTGKTIMCLQYLYTGAAKYNEPSLFLSFAESKESIYSHGLKFGWDLKELEKKKKFTFVRYAPHEIVKVMEEGGGTIRDTIESIGAKRLVIDSLSAYALLFENEYKANQSILNLFEMLHAWNCTTLVTSEKPVDPYILDSERLGFLTDGIINLYYLRKDNRRKRSLEVLKMRNTNHSDKLFNFMIGKNGVAILR
ncbi:hypothetical protein J4450_00820 [Candidatus Micrarchaeota archaeon]|nr:hypothetical protein [Candidatus Micrarchaeota archaeon]